MLSPQITLTIIIAMLLGIITSLAAALYYLIRIRVTEKQVAKALTIRISLSLLLFTGLMLATAIGLIKPHSLGGSLFIEDRQK